MTSGRPAARPRSRSRTSGTARRCGHRPRTRSGSRRADPTRRRNRGWSSRATRWPFARPPRSPRAGDRTPRRERVPRPLGCSSARKHDLVGVDVPDPGDDCLIQQNRLQVTASCRAPRPGSNRGRGRTARGRVASSSSRFTPCSSANTRPTRTAAGRGTAARVRRRARTRGEGGRLRLVRGTTVNCPVMPEVDASRAGRPAGTRSTMIHFPAAAAGPSTFAPVTEAFHVGLPRPAQLLLALPHRRVIVRPTSSGRRSRTTVSTSGSSGMDSPRRSAENAEMTQDDYAEPAGRREPRSD